MSDMERIQQGMRVSDVTGKDIGKVEDYKFGDPEAQSADGQESPEEGRLLGLLGPGPDRLAGLPTELAERLLRVGYVKVKGGGHIVPHHFYVASDDIDGIVDDVVHLTIEHA